jgi:hypothetical protein
MASDARQFNGGANPAAEAVGLDAVGEAPSTPWAGRPRPRRGRPTPPLPGKLGFPGPGPALPRSYNLRNSFGGYILCNSRF